MIENNYDISMGHIPPQSIAIEEAILCSILIDYSTHDFVFVNLLPDDFYKPNHKAFFEVALEMYSENKKIDLITVYEDLKASGKAEEVGGYNYLVQLTNKAASTYHIEAHVERLKNISVSRHGLMEMTKAIQEIYQGEKQGKEILSKVIDETEQLLSRVTIKQETTFKDRFIQTLKKIEDNQGYIIGIDTGFHDLNALTSGLCAPDLTILAAGPGEGKSTLALNIASHVALHSGGKVLFFSYEMKEEQLMYKMISNDLNISVIDVRKGNLPKDALDRLKSYDANIEVFDKGSMPLEELVYTAKYEAIKNDVKLIVIDYLQLINIGIYSKKNQNRTEEVGIVSRKLKELAMEINVPIIALSQVNRDKHRKTYVLPDLRESGNIEQDADNVWFIFRPSMHNMELYQIGNEEIIVNDQTAILISAKNRLGETGEIEMKFVGRYSRFEELNPTVINLPEQPSLKPGCHFPTINFN